jgi:hypothetical protein
VNSGKFCSHIVFSESGFNETGAAPPHTPPGTAGLESTEIYTYTKIVLDKAILLDL